MPSNFRLFAAFSLLSFLICATLITIHGIRTVNSSADGYQYSVGKNTNDPCELAIALSGEKVPVCHNGKTRWVPAEALSAHLQHGDCPGPCESCGTSSTRILIEEVECPTESGVCGGRVIINCP